MKEWYSASELAGLPGMPGTDRGVRKSADRDVWTSRKRQGKGGGREYAFSSLPRQTQDYLLHQAAQQIAVAKVSEADTPPVPVDTPSSTTELADGQRAVMQARLRVLDFIDELRIQVGSTGRAVSIFVDMARAGTLPAEMVDILRTANARRGNGRLAHKATIYRWLERRERMGTIAVAPKGGMKSTPPVWLPKLLALYQRPQKPSISACLREWVNVYPDVLPPPLRTAQRRIAELPVEVREWGRMGRNALRSVQPFVRRTTDGLWPMDIVTVDGHLFKAYPRHPLTGRRFRPELTTYLDIATRRAVGFSAWIAESQFAIWGALREMVLDPECGIPAMHYSDNGAYRGEQHRTVMARIGTTMMFSEAYRAQARGVIERFNSSVWVPLAKRFATYVGDDADPEAVKKALRKADETGAGLMAWEDFIAECRHEIDAYNNRPHSSLGGLTPNQAWERAVEEGWRPTLLDNDDLHDLLPSVERTVRRGEISLPWGKYYHDDLAIYHGRTVRAAIHPTDGGHVWVSDDRGVLICVAERGANARPYVAQSMLDHARAQREQGRVQRLERKLEAVREEGAALIEIPTTAPVDPVIQAEVVEQMEDADVEAITDERRLHAYWMRVAARIEAGEDVMPDEAEGCRVYLDSPQCQSQQEFFEAFGLTAEDFG